MRTRIDDTNHMMKSAPRFAAPAALVAAVLLLSLVSCESPTLTEPCPVKMPLFIEGHVTWSAADHPDLISQDIRVRPSATLEILEGTEIQFLPGSVTVCDPAGNYTREPKLIVEGSLIISGAESAMVAFMPSDSSDAEFGPIELEDGSECLIEFASLHEVDADGISPVIRSSEIGYLYMDGAEDAEITGNSVDRIFAFRCRGTIAGNTVEEYIYLRDDSLAVTRNYISGADSSGNAGITSAGTSTAYIAENCLTGCDTGLEIFSGSPVINYNDFNDCTVNIRVIPFLDAAEADTIDARHNWWGTTDGAEILAKIVYEDNGGTVSGKVIRTDPFETGPVMGCVGMGSTGERHQR